MSALLAGPVAAALVVAALVLVLVVEVRRELAPGRAREPGRPRRGARWLPLAAALLTAGAGSCVVLRLALYT